MRNGNVIDDDFDLTNSEFSYKALKELAVKVRELLGICYLIVA